MSKRLIVMKRFKPRSIIDALGRKTGLEHSLVLTRTGSIYNCSETHAWSRTKFGFRYESGQDLNAILEHIAQPFFRLCIRFIGADEGRKPSGAKVLYCYVQLTRKADRIYRKQDPVFGLVSWTKRSETLW